MDQNPWSAPDKPLTRRRMSTPSSLSAQIASSVALGDAVAGEGCHHTRSSSFGCDLTNASDAERIPLLESSYSSLRLSGISSGVQRACGEGCADQQVETLPVATVIDLPSPLLLVYKRIPFPIFLCVMIRRGVFAGMSSSVQQRSLVRQLRLGLIPQDCNPAISYSHASSGCQQGRAFGSFWPHA